METIRKIQKAAAMTTGDWLLHHNDTPANALHLGQFFSETANHPGNSTPLQPRLGTLQLLAFPQS